MKSKIALFIVLCAFINTVFAQSGYKAKKPVIMIVPSDNWMTQNGFSSAISNQGKQDFIYDYGKAFANNFELISVISQVNGLFQSREFPLKSLEEELKKINNDQIADDAMESENGVAFEQNKFEKILQTAQADIVIYLSWNKYKNGIQNSLRIILEAKDPVTRKAIASQQSISQPSSSATIDILLEEAVLNVIDNFNAKLQSHFDDMFANGREVNFRIKKLQNWDGDFNKQYGGKDLTEIIEDWFLSNTVKGRFTLNATKNSISVEQARIPLFDEKGSPLDSRAFARKLRKYLNGTPYNIPCNVTGVKLGEAIISVGN
jgi:hypothetical protein